MLLTAATDYTLYRRWPIFPCERRGKKPLTTHGLKDASTDCDNAWATWERCPDANIGLATGAGAGVIVLDVDGEAGRVSLAALEAAHGPLPVTLAARTGRDGGGTHLYFAYSGADVRNSAGRVGTGLDVRGEGGYIILPPSVHESGRRYEWLNDLDPAPLPTWVRTLMLASAPQAMPRPVVAGDDALMERARAYIARIPAPKQGTRDRTMFSAAGHLAALRGPRGEALTEPQIITLLLGLNMLCDAPLLERDIVAKVKSALQNGTPREIKAERPFSPRRTPWRSPFDVSAI